MDIFLLALYAIMIYMIVRMFAMRRTNRKMSKVIELVKLLEDENAFMEKADEYIQNAAGDEERTKFQILKLWGICYHGKYGEYESLLDEVRPEHLLGTRNSNDDSFFYLFLAIPNILQAAGRWEELDALVRKTEEQKEIYEKRLDYQIAGNCNRYYKNEGDRGFSFFEAIMDGSYEEYSYNRQLIGLYKQVVASMLVSQYEERGDRDHYDEMKAIADGFRETRIGEMWIANLGGKQEMEDRPEEEMPAAEESGEVDLSEGTESGTSFVEEEKEEQE